MERGGWVEDEEGSTPEEKAGKIALFPWDIPRKRDKSWPPPPEAGNYAGEETQNGAVGRELFGRDRLVPREDERRTRGRSECRLVRNAGG
jgi:hypothetical protein